MTQLNSFQSQARTLNSMAPLLGELGALQTRLARTQTEIRAAQAIRYRVFYDEMGGSPSPANRASKRDQDEFDRHCDHLLVIDSGGSRPQIVGTYRMMLKSQARLAGAFYTEQEYDIDPLFAANPDATFLELGRSCILPQYRTKRTMELLWHGTWTHALENKVDIMFGCASFAGTDPEATADALNWLGQNAVLDSDEDCAAVAPNHVKLMDRFADSHDRLSMRRAMAGMPPLIKGYLRLGARVGSQAVIDHQFSTTDILVVLKVHQINPRYLAHFGISASRFATQG